MSSDSDATCPSDAFFGNPVQPIIGDRTFHDIARYVSGGCTAVSIILCFGLCFMHLCTYRDRHEQRQIARIVLTPAIISTFDLLSVVFYSGSGFLKPIGEYYDAVALVSLYLLFVTYATQPEGRGNPRRLFESIPNLYAQHSYQQLSNNELGQYYVSILFCNG
jgi:peptidoglycan/LPS O-acetylase OafA/YrhL